MTDIVEIITELEIVELVVADETLLLVGPPGADGSQGPAAVPGMYSGNGPPSEQLNVADESLYLDLSNFNLYKLGE